MSSLLYFAMVLAALVGQEVRAPIPVLVVTGANNHDWRYTSRSLADMLEASGRFEVTVTEDPARDLARREAIARYRCFVLDYNGPRWGKAAETAFLEAVRGGAGVAVIHAANNAFPGWREYELLVGLCWRDGSGHGAFHAFDVHVRDRRHLLGAALPDLEKHPDELYHGLVHMHDAPIRVLATAWSDPATGGSGQHEPMVIVSSFGAGRVFHTPLGHVWPNDAATRASHTDPGFRTLVVLGTEWAATGAVTRERRSNGPAGGDRRDAPGRDDEGGSGDGS